MVGEMGVVDFSKLRNVKVNRTTYAVNGTIKILQDIANDILVRKHFNNLTDEIILIS